MGVGVSAYQYRVPSTHLMPKRNQPEKFTTLRGLKWAPKIKCIGYLALPPPLHPALPLAKQDFAVRELPSTRGKRHVEAVEVEAAEAEARGQRHGPQREAGGGGGGKKYEPCRRWRSLHRSSSNGYLMSLLVKK